MGDGILPKTKRDFINHILGREIIRVRGLVKFVPAVVNKDKDKGEGSKIFKIIRTS